MGVEVKCNITVRAINGTDLHGKDNDFLTLSSIDEGNVHIRIGDITYTVSTYDLSCALACVRYRGSK